MIRVKIIHSEPEKRNVWRYVKIVGIALLALHAFHRHSKKKKMEKWEKKTE